MAPASSRRDPTSSSSSGGLPARRGARRPWCRSRCCSTSRCLLPARPAGCCLMHASIAFPAHASGLDSAWGGKKGAILILCQFVSACRPCSEPPRLLASDIMPMARAVRNPDQVCLPRVGVVDRIVCVLVRMTPLCGIWHLQPIQVAAGWRNS